MEVLYHHIPLQVRKMKNPILITRAGLGPIAARKVLKGEPLLPKAKASLSSTSNCPSTVETWIPKRKRKPILLQHLFTSDYILKKIFRKEGPPLHVEFDSLPSWAFCHRTVEMHKEAAGREF
ncbi:hypothetical protein SO802_006290 [Lithocarpus litseifolius]|uniref:Uncharacterized protein n=1 Tax=Lithocarpus litseifolius TaxID=425828 RepID=A0AAW2DKG4_9ROSI